MGRRSDDGNRRAIFLTRALPASLPPVSCLPCAMIDARRPCSAPTRGVCLARASSHTQRGQRVHVPVAAIMIARSPNARACAALTPLWADSACHMPLRALCEQRGRRRRRLPRRRRTASPSRLLRAPLRDRARNRCCRQKVVRHTSGHVLRWPPRRPRRRHSPPVGAQPNRSLCALLPPARRQSQSCPVLLAVKSARIPTSLLATQASRLPGRAEAWYPARETRLARCRRHRPRARPLPPLCIRHRQLFPVPLQLQPWASKVLHRRSHVPLPARR